MILERRFLLGGLGLMGLAAAGMLLQSDRTTRREIETRAREELTREARTLQALLPPDPSDWGAFLARTPAGDGRRITILDPAGRVTWDTEETPPTGLPGPSSPDLLGDRPEIRSAIAGLVGVDRRRSVTTGEQTLFVAVPGTPIVRTAVVLRSADAAVRRARMTMIGGAVVVLLLGGTLLWLTGRFVSRQLTMLEGAVRDLPTAEGPRLERSGIPELIRLHDTLREVSTRLRGQFVELHHDSQQGDALVDAMVEGVLACDRRGTVIRANPAARRLLGYGPEDALPLLPALFRQKQARALADAALRGDTVTNGELPLDDRTLLVSARPLPGGGTVLVLHEVTELRRLETVRRDFVANVSHELKTPLTSITGYVETLLHDTTDAATTRQFLSTIRKNARRMQDLIDDQLDLARIESGHYTPAPRPLDPDRAIHEAWAPFADGAARRGLTWRLEADTPTPTLFADPNAIRQILSNLFSNAIRYTGEEGSITCQVRPRDGGVEVAISDTGIGIAGDHLPRIFERFYRVDPSRSRDEGGTGLGLAIVKHLVESHGGQAAAESTLGQGTTIRCWFPAEPAPRGD